jgi:transposase, IS5 family
MEITDLFALEFRMRKIDQCRDPLRTLDKAIPWELFRRDLETIRDKERKSNAGRKPYDVILMFKILVLKSMYNLSYENIEFMILDRLSFMRFLGLNLGDSVPDSNTIRLFVEDLTEANLVERLFQTFDNLLTCVGLEATKGQIVDASIVEAPKQRNTREENKQIKNGQTPEGWSDEKRRQKDTDARWTKKNGQSHYGYKNHIDIDVGHKFIRRCVVTDASVHDSQVIHSLLDRRNTNKAIYADAAYWSKDTNMFLEMLGYRPHIQRKGVRNKPLSDREKAGNRTRSRTRSRVEHVFGAQYMMAGGSLIIRTIGLARAKTQIWMRNLTYNLSRYAMMEAS